MECHNHSTKYADNSRIICYYNIALINKSSVMEINKLSINKIIIYSNIFCII